MEGDLVEVDIGSQFSRYPAGRTPKDGRFSGLAFREKFLEDPIRAGKMIRVSLDSALSYGSSFLEEAFGGLVRITGISAKQVASQIDLVSADAFLVEEINSYIKDAAALD